MSMEDTKLLTSDTDQLRIVGSAAEATGLVVWLFKVCKFLTSILAFLLTEVGGDKSKASEGAKALFLLASELRLGLKAELLCEGAEVTGGWPRKLPDLARLIKACVECKA